MIAATQYKKFIRPLFLLFLFGLLAFETANAVTEPPTDYSIEELEELVGPVALYPDDLIAIILPAASYPLQIVEASRYLEKLEKNPGLKPDDDWDDAVVALLNYPEIIALLNEDLDWTWNLGEAVVNQQPAVLDAIQDFRSLAVEAGNLKSDKRQTVSQVDEVIEVTPVDPEVIYVPDYQPRQVIVYQSRPVYSYYPTAYPLYYYPYPIQHRFASGFFWGVTTAYTVGWLTDRVQFHYFGQLSHPYFGHHYTSQYYAPHAGRIRHTRSFGSQRQLSNSRARFGNTWRASDRHGHRPGNRRARTNRDHNVASDFSGSTTRQNRAARDHKRANVRNRVDRNVKRAQSSQTRDQNRSTRRTWRRSDDSVRKNASVAHLDRSSNGKSSRRSATTNSRAGSNAFTGTRNKQHNKTNTRSTHKPRAGNSERIKRSTSRRTDTRAPSRREHRPAVRNTNRSTTKHRANTSPAAASRNHSANTTRSAGSTTSHQQSGSHRSGSRGGHSGSRGGRRR